MKTVIYSIVLAVGVIVGGWAYAHRPPSDMGDAFSRMGQRCLAEGPYYFLLTVAIVAIAVGGIGLFRRLKTKA